MTNIILCGCGGRMGKAIAAALPSDVEIIAGVDINASALSAALPFPVYENISDFPGKADVIVDFSHHSALPSLLAYAKATKTPLVVATTGHTDEELALMKSSADEVALFHSGNFSIGINLLVNLARQAARTLGVDFDIEIIEKHHNKKLDAPSGTALMLASAICEVRTDACVKTGRAGREKREPSEIGIHAIRMGNIVGEHEVIVGTENQTISLKHEAHSRALFAEGAIAAAAFLCGQPAGLYNMQDLLKDPD